LQHLGIIDDPYIIPTNSDACQPADLSEWPPTLIFDFFYGCSALNAWGPKGFKKFVQDFNVNDYYKSAEATFGESSNKEVQVKEREARYKQREKRREEQKDDQEDAEHEFGEVMDVVMALWMRHAPKCEPEQDSAHIPMVDHSQQEKVEAWLKSS